MNTRQQLYKKYRLEGYSKYASAIKAGYSHNTAINAKKNIENRLNFEQLLEIEGLTDTELAKHAKEGLTATKLQSVNFKTIERPDWKVRHSYFETILKLQNKLKDKGVDVKVGVNVENKIGENGSFSGEDQEFSRHILEALGRKLQE